MEVKTKIPETPKNSLNQEKGGSLMKKVVGSFLAITLVLGLTAQIVFADTQETVNINASATVIGIAEFEYHQVKNISNQENATDILFGEINRTVETWNHKAQQYVELGVDDNYIWELRLYTNNFETTPSSITWGTQYGGLVGPAPTDTDIGHKVAMGWKASNTLITGGPTTGNPQDAGTNGWTYIKDYSDIEDPDIDGDNSFSFAVSTGYCNIAFGMSDKTYVIMPNEKLTDGMVELANPTDHFYLYFEGDFSSAYPTSYTGNLELQLYHK